MDTDFAPREIVEFEFGALTETIIVSWVIMAFLVIISIITTRNLEKIPSGLQNFMELVYEGIEWLVDSTMGEKNRAFLPYMGTLTLYLIIANLTGLLNIRPPTSDVNTTFGLAAITFVLVHYSGVRSKGAAGYMKSFAEPLPFLLPLNLVSEIAQPFSLAFRLFGNMVGAFIIMALIYSFAPILIPVLPHMYFDIFAGIIQTFIFVMLTMTYISLAED
ncbi:F0F1 ATP synthase subunit A [Natranaerobius thermophilus]|uniref:ATP synthase subunit a n=1 Tax=Natranaerobius thermophilus (strain ATCC BAA-1301 / DSM 18059 / JW/NM-WN-LF) TaxID=457570 RepID=B2A3G9_NATTJ|nr:F0F1 ATP synthase subunit A [Natranaerobius thermophilus]ACB86398.1 ATP synthase F0, A subunit [Natranaerobius thermophilus JW/NM-WN-LF]